MCDVSNEAPDISILYQSSNPFGNVIQKPHGVAEKVHRPQDPSCLAEELLPHGGKQEEGQRWLELQAVGPARRPETSPIRHPIGTNTNNHFCSHPQAPPFHELQRQFSQTLIPQRLPATLIKFPYRYSSKKDKQGMKQEWFFTHTDISISTTLPFPPFPHRRT